MKRQLCILAVTALAMASPFAIAHGSSARVVSPDEVLAMMRGVPVSERTAIREPEAPGYRWDRAGDAREIAEAISASAPTVDEAKRMVVYAIFESALRKDRIGDGGRSVGAWQLSTLAVPPWVSLVPRDAARAWVRLAEASRTACAGNPAGTELAALVSGRCDAGHEKARLRDALSRRISSAP